MVITDLDGTLALADGSFLESDLATLHRLGHERVPRAVATGRSPHAARKLLAPDFPIDYLIFSCGAGVMDWRTGEILTRREIDAETADGIASVLVDENVDFMIHAPIPENHYYLYYETGRPNADFRRRVARHTGFCRPWKRPEPIGLTSQFLVVDPVPHSGVLHERVCKLLPETSVIRSTSPLDHQSAWIEIFAMGVSKGLAAEWLASRLGVRREKVMAIGNDYNDLDVLSWAGYPYVVANAPDSLKQRFREVAHHAAGGFTEAVTHWRQESQYYF